MERELDGAMYSPFIMPWKCDECSPSVLPRLGNVTNFVIPVWYIPTTTFRPVTFTNTKQVERESYE